MLSGKKALRDTHKRLQRTLWATFIGISKRTTAEKSVKALLQELINLTHEIRSIEGLTIKLTVDFKKQKSFDTLNHNLEAMAKQLYDYWFVQFDFPDENGNPYKSSGFSNNHYLKTFPGIGVSTHFYEKYLQ